MNAIRSCPQCSIFVCNVCFVEMCSTALAEEDDRSKSPVCPNCRCTEDFKHEPLDLHLMDQIHKTVIEKQALKKGFKVSGETMHQATKATR